MPLRRSLVAAVAGILAVVLLAGCGDSRTRPPDLTRIEPTGGVKPVDYLHGALRFNAPDNWAIESGTAPLVVTLGSGPAVIAIWRYPRSPSQPLPGTVPALEQARSALVAAAHARDPSFRIISSAVVALAGTVGVELDALETVRGQVRRVRSAHLYLGGAEIVVDEFAPEDLFHGVDGTVFSPLLHSVRLAG
jgi:hypothetical protein